MNKSRESVNQERLLSDDGEAEDAAFAAPPLLDEEAEALPDVFCCFEWEPVSKAPFRLCPIFCSWMALRSWVLGTAIDPGGGGRVSLTSMPNSVSGLFSAAAIVGVEPVWQTGSD